MTSARLDALLREAHAARCAVVMVPDARRVELVPWPDDEPPPWTDARAKGIEEGRAATP